MKIDSYSDSARFQVPDKQIFVCCTLQFALLNSQPKPISELLPNPSNKPKDADHQYSACLRSGGAGITIGTFFFLYKEALPD
ncbi:MAG TPA: hypothetical protein DCR04_06865 [Flavobacteriales bacterium]|nr:hypothetical protein [Flavobacteriales bacterium]